MEPSPTGTVSPRRADQRRSSPFHGRPKRSQSPTHIGAPSSPQPLSVYGSGGAETLDFSEVDANGDGVIDREEWEAAMRRIANRRSPTDVGAPSRGGEAVVRSQSRILGLSGAAPLSALDHTELGLGQPIGVGSQSYPSSSPLHSSAALPTSITAVDYPHSSSNSRGLEGYGGGLHGRREPREMMVSAGTAATLMNGAVMQPLQATGGESRVNSLEPYREVKTLNPKP